MTARDEILARVRAALAGAPAAPAPPPVPRDYRRNGEAEGDVVALFAERVADYRASVHLQGRDQAGTLERARLVSTLVADLLRDTSTLVVPVDVPDGWLSGFSGQVRREPVPVPELDAPGVSVLTGCAVAIADTGTIVLDTGPAQGSRALTLVPDHHVCVVATGQIVAGVPEALARLADPTRPLTLISGPSATSDIELNRVEGVHGPRRLDVIITSLTPEEGAPDQGTSPTGAPSWERGDGL